MCNDVEDGAYKGQISKGGRGANWKILMRILLSPSLSMFLLDWRWSLKVNYSTTRSFWSNYSKILRFLLDSCLASVSGCRGILVKTMGGSYSGCSDCLLDYTLISPQQKTLLDSASYTMLSLSSTPKGSL
jgi:hypothetical protein